MDRTLSGQPMRGMAPAPSSTEPVPGSSRIDAARASRPWRFIRSHGIVVALGLLLVAGALLSPYFLTPANAANVARQASIIGLLGVGMTFVILTAGIDLSAGSILGFAAIAFAMAITAGLLWPLAIAVALAAGAGMGAINGLGITKGRLQPFIMTLGMLVIARGVTMTIASGKPIPLGEAGREVAWIGSGDLLGIPVPVLLFVAIAALAWFTLRYTPFGRQVYAVGDNLEAARLSGIDTNRTVFAVYVISGLCAALSALIVVSRLTAGEPSQGTGYELDAIAIVVIGGTSLFGGEGGIGGTVIGAAIVAAMNNLLNLLGVSPFSQQIVKGLIILGAVYLERRSVKAEGR
jgi:ribose/xylose/arabinose/galactoside ABC-type transport system permease subunit